MVGASAASGYLDELAGEICFILFPAQAVALFLNDEIYGHGCVLLTANLRGGVVQPLVLNSVQFVPPGEVVLRLREVAIQQVARERD